MSGISDWFNFASTPGPTTTSSTSADSFALPLWQQLIQGQLGQIQNMNFQPYGGPTVAPQNFMQQTANDMGYNLATGGTPAGNAANSAITSQALGANLANPYATTLNPYMGAQNSYLGATNPYQGDNPYLQNMVQGVNNDITRAYSQGTAAQTDAAFNQAGAYGGSAYQSAVANNQNDLAKQLANADANIYGQNYYNSGNIAGQDLARNASLEQTGINNNQQLGENALNRATGSYQNALGQQLSAAGLGLQSQGVDMNSIGMLSGLGAQQQGTTQNALNAGQNYYNQQQMAGLIPYDLAGQALMNYSNANRVNTMQGPATSGLTNLVGGIGAIGTLFPQIGNFFSGGSNGDFTGSAGGAFQNPFLSGFGLPGGLVG